MKRHGKVWPRFTALILMIGLALHTRIPLSIYHILGFKTSADVETYTIGINEWEGNDLASKRLAVHTADFEKVIKNLEEERYIRYFGNPSIARMTDHMYTVELAYRIEGEQDLYQISLTNGGFVSLAKDGKEKYYIFQDEERGSTVMKRIYEEIGALTAQ